MRYSTECEYAIRAAIYLAEHPDAVHYPLELATQESIPQHFLLKAMGALQVSGIVNQTDEVIAGYRLSRSPEAITLFDIKTAVDGLADLEECAIGFGECSDSVPCALHESYKPLRQAWRDYLEQTTLRDLAAALHDKREQLGIEKQK